MIDLEKMYGRRYKITMDESWALEKSEFKSPEEKFWYYEIWGRRGWCYNQNPATLAVEVNNSVWPKFERSKLFPYDHVRGGDETQKILVKEEHVDKAISFLIPHKRRVLSEAQKAANSERLAKFRFSSAPRIAPQAKVER